MFAILPNALSALRILSVPALLALAYASVTGPFLALIGAALASDVLDGFLARRFGLASELGARLDSWADLTLYAALPACAYWLWPEVVRAQLPYVGLIALAYLAPIGVGWLKFGRMPCYHTWGAKATAAIMPVALVFLFVFDQPWLFHAATGLFLMVAVEEILITAVLLQWRPNVPTFLHAVATRT